MATDGGANGDRGGANDHRGGANGHRGGANGHRAPDGVQRTLTARATTRSAASVADLERRTYDATWGA